jgi:FkbM family methyltransferase
MTLDTVLAGVTADSRATRLLIPLVRAYVRYAPVVAGKEWFWYRVAAPYFAWSPHEFVVSTLAAGKIGGNTSDIIAQYIYYFGVWEPHLTRWIARRLSPGDTFIDVGANIGYFSLLASTLVGPSGSVVAIEASPKIFRALRENAARNRATNIRTLNVATSDRAGSLRLFRGPPGNAGMTTTLEEAGLELECEVEAAPLDALVRPEERRRARVINIDVEGAETAVVEGMASLLRSGRPDLEAIVEVHPKLLALRGRRSEDVVRMFGREGFHAYGLEKDYGLVSPLVSPTERRPRRLRGPIRSEIDIVFSREDAESL